MEPSTIHEITPDDIVWESMSYVQRIYYWLRLKVLGLPIIPKMVL